MSFAVAQLRYLNVPGVFCKDRVGPDECYYYLRDHWRAGLTLDLACVLRTFVENSLLSTFAKK